MNRIKYFFLLFSILLINNSCVENGITFPPFVNNGTFEVLIGGQVFSASEVTYINDDNQLVITAINSITDEIFTLQTESFVVGSFSLEGENNVATYVNNDALSSGIWTTLGETTSRGNIELSDINFSNNTISGTFSFIAKNADTGSAQAFSNGTFQNVPLYRATASGNSFSAKVDGVEFQEISLFSNTIAVGATNVISIVANKSSNEVINLSLDENITVGTYNFGSIQAQSYPLGIYSIAGNDLEGDGEITITNHDTSAKQISGIFNFEASPSTASTPNFSITDGFFNVSY